MNKTFFLYFGITIVFIIGTVLVMNGGKSSKNLDTVSVVDGTQIIQINAKGGYSPRVVSAKADLPTVLKVETRGTFDCSSALVIPDLGYRNNLPPSGETEIEIPPQKAGTILRGLCAMGMYHFEIEFTP